MKKTVLEEIKARLGDGYKVTENEITKNNGIVLHGVCIQKEGEFICPNIYVDNVPEDEVVDFVLSRYEEVMSNGSKPDVDKIKKMISRDGILEHAFPCIVNRKMNECRFDSIVHKPYLDMEIIYRMSFGGGAFVTLTKQMLEAEGVTEDELYEAAVDNIQGEGQIHRMIDLLGIPVPDDGPNLLVVTNNDKTLGAGMILDEAVLEHLEEEFGEFYILPSSIHEVIVVPDYMGSVDTLRKMVKQQNETMAEDEVLSDNVYVCRNGEVVVA